jgi:hypothetical protein
MWALGFLRRVPQPWFLRVRVISWVLFAVLPQQKILEGGLPFARRLRKRWDFFSSLLLRQSTASAVPKNTPTQGASAPEASSNFQFFKTNQAGALASLF